MRLFRCHMRERERRNGGKLYEDYCQLDEPAHVYG